MLAHGAEELDQLGVAGVEADPDAGQVGALGEGVHGDHAVGAVLEHRAGRAVPGELGVALVGEHGDAVGPPPGRLRTRGRPRPPVGFEGEFDQSSRARARVGRVDGVEIEAAEPPGRGRDRDGAAPGQLRPHGVGRIGHRGVQHRVPVRLAQPEQVRHRGHELLRPDAGGDRRRRDVGEPEAARQPPRPRPRAAAGCRPRRGSPARCPTTPAPRPPRAAAGRRACRWSSRPCRPRGASATLARPASRS